MFRGEPPTPSALHDIAIGRFRIRLVYRRNDIDEGLTVHVFGPAGGRDEEMLRFDCFRAQPHYHLAWSYREAPFVPIAQPDSLLGQFRRTQLRPVSCYGSRRSAPRVARQRDSRLKNSQATSVLT
jgi:hypothetical protein